MGGQVLAAVQKQHGRLIEVRTSPSRNVQRRLPRRIGQVGTVQRGDEPFLRAAYGADPQSSQQQVAGLKAMVDRPAGRFELLGDGRHRSPAGPAPCDQAGGGIEHLLAVELGRPAHAVSVVNLECCRYYCAPER